MATFVARARAVGPRAELFTTTQACAHRLNALGITIQLAPASA